MEPKYYFGSNDKYYIDEHLIGVNDSLELDSNQIMAYLTLTKKNGKKKNTKILVELRVEGEVKIDYKGKTYKTPSDFPDGLKKLIKSGCVDRSKCTEVHNNNWFEVYIYVNGNYSGYSEVVDGGWKSHGDVFGFLLDCAYKYIEDFLENE